MPWGVMKRLTISLVALLAGSVMVLSEEGEDELVPNPLLDPSSAHVEAALDQSLEQWWAWRDEQIDYLLTPFDCEGVPCININDLAFRAHELNAFLVACRERKPALFEEGSPVASLLKNLERFAAAVGLQDDPEHRMGFSMPDQAFLDTYRDEISFPKLLRSEAFLQAVSDPASYKEAYEMIEARNDGKPKDDQWISFLYKSRFIKTPDETTYGRFFVYVPGEVDKWIQFGIVTPDMDDVEINSASIVSVRRDAGDRLNRTGWVIDYWREYEEGGIELKTKVEAGQGGANCYNCHKMPVLPIRPHEVYTFGEHGELVVQTDGADEIPDRLNQMIEAYGRVDLGEYMDTEGYGPTIGPPDRERSFEQLRAWTEGMALSHRQLRNVRKNMTCGRCHHDTYMGRLNFPTAVVSDQDTVDLLHPVSGEPNPLIKAYIANGWMPPGNKLSAEEREALYMAVMQEYYDREAGRGELLDWLRNVTN